MDLHLEALVMVRSALPGQNIRELFFPVLLDDLLEFRLVVFKSDGVLFDGVHDKPEHKGAGGFDAAVQIDRRDDRLKGVGQDAGAVPAAGLLLALAEEHVRAEVQFPGEVAAGFLADRGGAELGELPLRHVAEVVEEGVRGDEAEDGVAEELEALVVLVPRPLLVGIGGVGQRRVQEREVLEGVPEFLFQLVEGGGPLPAEFSSHWWSPLCYWFSPSEERAGRSRFGVFCSMMSMTPVSA